MWAIDIYHVSRELNDSELLEVITSRIEQFDRDYSRFRDDSLVTHMAEKAGSYTLPADAQPLLDLYRQIYNLSAGAVTPLIGQTLVDAGYDAKYSLHPGQVQTPPVWDDVLDYRWPQLTLRVPALLDFGAAGKGYLVDIIADLLASEGATDFCVDAGGDIVCRSPASHPTIVGLEDPEDTSQAIGVSYITNQALCGSAGSRRTWGQGSDSRPEGYHHVIDPHTLRSPRHLSAVWVIADSALLSDMLTTVLYFVDPQVMLEHFDFSYALLDDTRGISYSDTFPGQFFIQ